MSESVRAHERMQRRPGLPATTITVAGSEVSLFVAPEAKEREAGLVIHFHGPPWLPIQAIDELDRPLVVASVHLGAGGGLYDRFFSDPKVFAELLDVIERASGVRPARRFLTGFSAGYGAIRAILRHSYDRIDGVLLLDGLHTGYVPERKPLAEGGALDASKLEPFRRLALDAIAGRKRLVITHSEIFPGTFASTTETAAWLLRETGVQARPVLRWGPVGMQQISEGGSGEFQVLGFAGNSAPDHVDHLHGYAAFVRLLLDGRL